MTGLTFSDADAVALPKPAVDKMETKNKVTRSTYPYAIGLSNVFRKYTKGEF